MMYPGIAAAAAQKTAKPKKPSTHRRRELILDLDYLASTYGLEGPYEFELGVSIEGNKLFMVGYRPKELK